jgi:hypothetical protein
MGLNASVYCDCYEAGRLREPPPPGCAPMVAEDGSVLCGSDELDVQLAFDQWYYFRACEHECGQLILHRIGNIALVAMLRMELQRMRDRFPLLLGRVLYNGVHCGDFLAVEKLPELRREITALAEIYCADQETANYVRGFTAQMSELMDCAMRVGKPIVF